MKSRTHSRMHTHTTHTLTPERYRRYLSPTTLEKKIRAGKGSARSASGMPALIFFSSGVGENLEGIPENTKRRTRQKAFHFCIGDLLNRLRRGASSIARLLALKKNKKVRTNLDSCWSITTRATDMRQPPFLRRWKDLTQGI